MEHLQLAINEIKSKMPRLELRLNEPMKNHCSFRIGGPVAAMALPGGREEAEELCRLLRRMKRYNSRNQYKQYFFARVSNGGNSVGSHYWEAPNAG
mgnify:CR=1 FL=1